MLRQRRASVYREIAAHPLLILDAPARPEVNVVLAASCTSFVLPEHLGRRRPRLARRRLTVVVP